MEHVVKSAELENNSEKYKCVYCGISFLKQGSLRKHVRTAYHWPPIPEDEQLKTRKKQSKPRRYFAGSVHQEDSTNRCVDENDNIIVTSEGPGILNNCLPGESSEMQPEKQFKCTYCGKAFLRKPDMIRHIRTHTGEKPFSCEYCESSFIRGNALRRHMRRHTGERPYHCELCGAAFTEKGNLKKHMRTHTGEKPFVCDECGATFAQRHSLQVHLSVHTGIKPFRCADCASSFVGKSQLQAHISTHTGEKPHTCAYCGVAYSQACDVKKHILRAHSSITSSTFKGHKCIICNATFGRKGLLMKHIHVHSIEKIHNSTRTLSYRESLNTQSCFYQDQWD